MSDDDGMGKNLRHAMNLHNAVSEEKSKTFRTVGLFIGLFIFLCIGVGIFYMLGAF